MNQVLYATLHHEAFGFVKKEQGVNGSECTLSHLISESKTQQDTGERYTKCLHTRKDESYMELLHVNILIRQ